ncbi:MAG: DUF502 domain-containing protein [Tissierellales bacterium]|jgi:uncharacterized membrane protein|nr:DUF502 domain-containing protein [Tissierellales bacterium]
MKKVQKTFLAGVFTLLPLALTLYIIKLVFNFFDNMSRNVIQNFVGFYIPGLGFLLTLGLIFIVGIIANHVIGKRLFDFFGHLFGKIPFVNLVYKAIKDVSTTLSKKSTEGFSRVVLVEFPMKDTLSIGFITNEEITVNKDGKVAVFIPTTPNPTNGFLIMVDPDKVKPSELTIDEAVKTVMSMGSVGSAL